MMLSRQSFLLLAAGLSSVDGFTINRLEISPRTGSSSSRLHLVPEQGKQLVAYSEAALVQQQQQQQQETGTDDKVIRLQQSTQQNKPLKTFVSRIFSIPGAIMGRHPAAAAPAMVDVGVSLKGGDDDCDGDDVVLYPIVGFQFVNGGQQVLPTKTNASCRIVALPDQEVYGWYTGACPLDSIYSDTYCEEPKN